MYKIIAVYYNCCDRVVHMQNISDERFDMEEEAVAYRDLHGNAIDYTATLIADITGAQYWDVEVVGAWSFPI